MTMIARRQVLGVSGAVAATLASPYIRRAQAAGFAYKFGCDTPPDHPLSLRMQEASDRIRSETDGLLQIKVFPFSSLGSDTDMLSQLRSGALEFMTLSGNILSTLLPLTSINGIAFAFQDYATVWRAMDGDLGAHVRAAIGKAGLTVMPHIFDNGFRQMTSSTHPIATPDDLNGFKMRVPVSPLWVSTFRALGASPVSINASEMYSALQTKVADGQENALPAIWTTKIYEVQKYCAMTSHIWDGFWFLANSGTWRRLPEDARAVAARHFEAAALAERADVAAQDAKLRSDLEAKGMVFNTPERAPFREKLRKAGFFAEWKKTYGDEAWAILERYAGPLG